MTTVAAAAVDGTVVIAADSMTNVYDRPIVGAATKIRRLAIGTDAALLAFCGNGGLANAADSVHIEGTPNPADEDSIRKWAVAVAEAITGWAVDTGLVEDGSMDGTILLGWHGRLWTLTHAQAIPHPDGRAALGSGEGPAMGAMDALFDVTDLPVAEVVTRAAQIGIARDRFSGGPIQVEVLTTETRLDSEDDS